MGSNRLPGKLLHSFFGETILERMINIVKATTTVEDIVVAYGGHLGVNIAKQISEKHNVTFYLGDEENVLSRYIEVLQKYDNKYALRVTCDNYLVQPKLIDQLFHAVIKERSDYGYISPLSHYCGEVINIPAFLEFHAKYKTHKNDKEHVTIGFRLDDNKRQTTFRPDFAELNHSMSLTLDTVEDLIKMKTIEQKFEKLRQYDCLDELKELGGLI